MASKNSSGELPEYVCEGRGTGVEVKEGFGNQINLYRNRGLNSGPLAQKSDTLPLDRQVILHAPFINATTTLAIKLLPTCEYQVYLCVSLSSPTDPFLETLRASKRVIKLSEVN
uniref:Uncharacterized protein n=1 Tax=Timema genevievae TaxID=629358 RepID=A0A7R9K9P9_TIMGE|nr:unnamed protein product [Timema genevievae]